MLFSNARNSHEGSVKRLLGEEKSAIFILILCYTHLVIIPVYTGFYQYLPRKIIKLMEEGTSPLGTFQTFCRRCRFICVLLHVCAISPISVLERTIITNFLVRNKMYRN